MQIIMPPNYKQSADVSQEDYEREDHSPLNLVNYFDRGSSIMAVTTTSPGAIENINFVYTAFKIDNLENSSDKDKSIKKENNI